MAEIRERKDESDADRKHMKSAEKFVPAGQSTQMVVGATATSDRQILETSTHLYESYGLRRIYYSSFSPFPLGDARLPHKAPPLVREHRLYQADWLMRYYKFEARELTSESEPDLSLTKDPKQVWAERHSEFFPVDVNAAPREALLRVPGIGYRNVERILKIRRYHRLSLQDLGKLRVRVALAGPLVIASDHLPTLSRDAAISAKKDEAASQLDLFAPRPVEVVSAITGEL
jgi:predicted DNA-binding helix-hairpin-helix protein